MNRCSHFSNLSEIPSMSTLSASFRNIQSKLKELWWQTFSNCASMEPCGCHSNQGVSLDAHEKHMLLILHPPPPNTHTLPRGMLQMRNDWDQPADCGDISGKRSGRINRLYYPLSSHGAFGQGELIIMSQHSEVYSMPLIESNLLKSL